MGRCSRRSDEAFSVLRILPWWLSSSTMTTSSTTYSESHPSPTAAVKLYSPQRSSTSTNLWHIVLPVPNGHETTTIPTLGTKTEHVLLLNEDTRTDRKYVQFIHACLGSPPLSTFLRAVERGYLSHPTQFPRLTAKMVRKHMPESEATARGHLNKTPTSQPHELSEAVSARRRAHLNNLKHQHGAPSTSPTTKPRVWRQTA